MYYYNIKNGLKSLRVSKLKDIKLKRADSFLFMEKPHPCLLNYNMIKLQIKDVDNRSLIRKLTLYALA